MKRFDSPRTEGWGIRARDLVLAHSARIYGLAGIEEGPLSREKDQEQEGEE